MLSATPAMRAAADRLDAGLLDGVEDGARLLALAAPAWRGCGCRGRRAAQRHGIAEPAGDGEFVGRRPSWTVPAGARARRPAPAARWRRPPRPRRRRRSTRMQPVTARLKRLGVAGARLGLLPCCRPAPPCLSLSAQRRSSTTLAALSWQFVAEGALVELGHQRALQLVALVEEGERGRPSRHRRRSRRSRPR